ncbi:unnamed protein product [Fusarium fujikuroi]|uniref:Insecticide toxin TcdB middle/N-terminal domain-containing protein n=1 Tax=Fusarium fujikuroi TaxID=5127 RepID=A0A9Q9UDN1_FUSFU|nr:unnamed protein product [Fusarium fujikuroi]
MSGADIVRVLTNNGSPETKSVSEPKGDYEVVMYRPRIDNGSLRVERWTSKADPTYVYWRTLSSDNETKNYGDSDGSRILETSNDNSRTFSWMLSKSYDAHGNAIEYMYKQEDAKDLVDASGVLPVWEKNRIEELRCCQKYIKTIKYGNSIPSRDPKSWEVSQWTKDMYWMFELIFDYGEHSHETPTNWRFGELGSLHSDAGLGSLCDDLQFGAPVILSQQPGIAGGVFQDLDRNGHVDYVLRDSQGVLQGYFERGDTDTWSSFSTFPETPNGDTWLDTLELDLTGDGLADTLCIADDSQGLAWQRPLIAKTTEVQTYVADMMGSGLSDLVEISSGSIRYWPNLGYRSFGAVVEMGNCPLLSEDSKFGHARVRLIDVDGSAGNRWSDKISISRLPAGLSPGSVFTLDILGKGTACLCWTDVSTGRNRVKYLDLTGDLKPHLLQSYSNGMGAKTRITYAPSTKFYVQDRNNGLPWSTKLTNPTSH